jgi:general secretion pathway protein E
MDKIVDGLTMEDIGEEDLEHLKDLASEAPVIKMVNLIMQRAIVTKASDIHIEPFEQISVVRFRIDGRLRDVARPKRGLHAALISRISSVRLKRSIF